MRLLPCTPAASPCAMSDPGMQPVGGRGNDQVNRLVGKPTEVAGITEAQRTDRLCGHRREPCADWLRVYNRTAACFKGTSRVRATGLAQSPPLRRMARPGPACRSGGSPWWALADQEDRLKAG